MEWKRVAFGLSTKDRVDLTRQILPGLDAQSDLDLFWCDGSVTLDGRNLPSASFFTRARLKEIHFDVTGGPDAAICYALTRMLRLGYGYVGLLENDVSLEKGWCNALVTAINDAERDGFRVGAATVRTLETRTLFHRPRYAMMWNMGAGMVLFSREGAEVVLADSHTTGSADVGSYWRDVGFHLDTWELWMDEPNRGLGADWWYAPALLNKGLVSVGSVPCLGRNIDMDIEREFRTLYIQSSQWADNGQIERFERFAAAYRQGSSATNLGPLT